MLSSVGTTHPKLSVGPVVLRLSRTSKIGWEHGLLRVKECTMVQNQCRSQAKIQHIQPSLILVVLNSQFLQMFSRKLEVSGTKLYPISIVQAMPHSATWWKAATQSPRRSNPSVSRWVITSSSLSLTNTYIKLMMTNAILSFTNADFQGRTRIFSSSGMHSCDISIQSTTLTRINWVWE